MRSAAIALFRLLVSESGHPAARRKAYEWVICSFAAGTRLLYGDLEPELTFRTEVDLKGLSLVLRLLRWRAGVHGPAQSVTLHFHRF